MQVTVNDRIKNLLKNKNFSYETIGERINVHKNTVSNMVNGKSDFSLAFLQFLLKEFPNVDMRKLLQEDETNELSQVSEPNFDYEKTDQENEALKNKIKELEEKYTKMEGEMLSIREQFSEILKWILSKQEK